MTKIDPLSIIDNWYRRRCDSRWEHEFGVKIESIDNPGWSLNLTGEQGKKTYTREIDRSDADWIHVRATESSFVAFGGSANLKEMLEQAADWLES